MRDEEKVMFVKLSCACEQLLKSPTKVNAADLNRIIKSLHMSSLKEHQIRILLTLLKVISSEGISPDIILSAVSTLGEVLMKIPTVPDFLILRHLIQNLIQLLFDPQNSKLIFNIPEELHLCALNSMCLLLTNLTSSQKEQFYCPKAAPFLGVLVCLCLEEAGKQQFRKIKVSAIECLMACAQVLKNPPEDDDENTQAGDIFMNFVPGVVKGLKQVICADEKQGHEVTVVALRAWGRLIAQVMDVPLGSQMIGGEEEKPKSLSSASNLAEVQQVISDNKRNAAFFKLADQMLQANVEAVCSAQNHSHHKVRLELIASAKLILVKCSKNLPNCVVPLLEVLVALSEDTVSEVSHAASAALEDVSRVFGDEMDLTEILEGNLYRVAEQLPSIFTKKDERRQLAGLGLLVGYLRLLSHKLQDALLLHCKLVLDSLMFVCTFETGHIVLLEDLSIKDDATPIQNRPWLQHKHFIGRDGGVLLRKACGILAQEAELVVPQLLAVMVDKPAVQKEAVHLINLTLRYLTEFSKAKLVAESFADPAVWAVPLSPEGDTTVAQARSNVVLACLLCEGLAAAATSSGRKVRELLSVVLYPVLERAGSGIELVSLAGRLALSAVASCLGHPSTAALVCCEAEYFTHYVTVKLRRPKDNPGALLVLCAILKHGSKDILPSVELVVGDVLTRCQDNRVIPRYMDVFLALISNIRRFFPPEEVQNSAKKVELELHHESPVVEQLLLVEKLSRASVTDAEEANEDAQKMTETEEKEKIVPIHIRLIEAVLQRCFHMLPSKDKDIQILALRAMKRGLPILEPYEDQLLPLVHKLWSPLLQRFSPNQDVVVLRLSFELLCIVASCSKNFIRHRCLEQVLPSICQFVRKQATVTSRHRETMLSQSMKLQKVALDRLAPLARDLDLQEEEIHTILEACSPYLSSEQPVVLQESCVELFKQISRINSDAVWLRLNILWNEGRELKSVSHACPNIRLPLLAANAGRYKANVQLLLQHITC
ncbi:Hypothetical predicted protein [Cloeon dipterum]|uniref:Uncharacterized protein n=2 Tax=Cloeon dipterum TaxID=197152 RepID=A0A8S1D8I0_9INSE|nr:Hypothetical predicted protein [Cloeon dipterum]